jgi:hypothetical protein
MVVELGRLQAPENRTNHTVTVGGSKHQITRQRIAYLSRLLHQLRISGEHAD